MFGIHWWYLWSTYGSAPTRSGPAHLTEHLLAYILDSAPKPNPTLTRSSEVITHFNTMDTIKRFFILPYISRSLYHGDSITFWRYDEPILLTVNQQPPILIISRNRATWWHIKGNIVHLWVKSWGISDLSHIGWLWFLRMLLWNNPDVQLAFEFCGYLRRL